DGEAVDRHLRALDELLDEGGAAARGRDRSTEGGRELTAVPHDRNRVAAAVRRLDHARHADVEMRVCRQPPADVRDAGLRAALAGSLEQPELCGAGAEHEQAQLSRRAHRPLLATAPDGARNAGKMVLPVSPKLPPRYDVPKAAPEPLRIVQELVNSVDLEHDIEWLGTPAELQAWLRRRRLDGAREPTRA